MHGSRIIGTRLSRKGANTIIGVIAGGFLLGIVLGYSNDFVII